MGIVGVILILMVGVKGIGNRIYADIAYAYGYRECAIEKWLIVKCY